MEGALGSRLAPGWMLGVVPAGLVAIGPEDEVEIAVDGGPGDAAALARAVAQRIAPVGSRGPADVPAAAYERLLELLDGLGAFGEEGGAAGASAAPAPAYGVSAAGASASGAAAGGESAAGAPASGERAAGALVPGLPLAAAVQAARAGRPPAGAAWTAEELLRLPLELPPEVRLRALRAFVSGLRPDGRLQAYALLSRGAGAVHGDAPAVAALAAGLAQPSPSPAAIEVISLTGAAPAWTVAPLELERIGALEPHRLGPIVSCAEPVAIGGDSDGDALHLCVAETAAGNLAAPGTAQDRVVQGVGTAAVARLVACAEGAERYATADLSTAEVVRARQAELPGAVDPASLYRGAQPSAHDDDAARERQPQPGAHDDAADAAAQEPRLWCAVTAGDGTRRWAPAETVHSSVVAAARADVAIPWTSSGVAAHLDLAQARQRAFCELIERDAFMWTWIRRVSRERVAARSAPAEARRLAALAARSGWQATWVNLSLDTLPVILCCLLHEHEGLTLGAACDGDPGAAVCRATREAVVLALGLRLERERRPRREQVRTPRDHVHHHRDPARWSEHGFLLSSPDELELGEVPGGDARDAEALLDGLGHQPLTADLTLAACAPFRVVRALAPGLLPLTFGWGREPLGMARARSPLTTRDGRLLGRHVEESAAAGMVVPHPFP